MKHWKIMHWCRTAVKKIRYTPDREAAYEELHQHLDDRSDGFLEQGLDQEEAVEKTLVVMGDPAELAPMLAAVHRPFWGYAYSITKALAKVTVIAALVLLAVNAANSLLNQEYKQPSYRVYDPYQDAEDEYASRIGLWEQSDSFSFGGYTYELEKCALWQPENDGEDVLHTRIRITNYLPWAATPYSSKQLEAVDNLENRYVNSQYNYTGQPCHLVGGSAVHIRPFVWLLDVRIYGADFEGVEWIEIRSQNNKDFVLRIDLTGGDGQ